jgi:hypothetical protein
MDRNMLRYLRLGEEILSCPNFLMLDLNLSFLICCLLFIQIKKIGWWRIKLHPLQFNLDMRGSALLRLAIHVDTLTHDSTIGEREFFFKIV